MLSVPELDETNINPLDTLEILVAENEWPYERMGNEEIVAAVTGEWCDFHLRFIWQPETNILQCAGQLDVRVHDKNRTNVLEAITKINDRIEMGHFSVWSDDDTLMFKHSFFAASNGADVMAACDFVTRTIIAEINKYFPVFQFVIWGGKTPNEALEAAMLETVGNA